MGIYVLSVCAHTQRFLLCMAYRETIITVESEEMIKRGTKEVFDIEPL